MIEERLNYLSLFTLENITKPLSNKELLIILILKM